MFIPESKQNKQAVCIRESTSEGTCISGDAPVIPHPLVIPFCIRALPSLLPLNTGPLSLASLGRTLNWILQMVALSLEEILIAFCRQQKEILVASRGQ